MRLIDAEALRKALTNKDLITWTHEYGDAIPVDWLMSVIDNAPTVEVRDNYDIGYAEGHIDGVLQGEKLYARPQGKWWNMQDDDLKIADFKCSVCNYWSDGDYNYCPNCGARMKDGAE